MRSVYIWKGKIWNFTNIILSEFNNRWKGNITGPEHNINTEEKINEYVLEFYYINTPKHKLNNIIMIV